MLTIQTLASNFGNGFFKSKCAEIHYQTQNFSILCIFCELSTFNFADFLEHFNSSHLEEFSKSLPCSGISTSFTENTKEAANVKTNEDPLEFGNIDIANNNPEEVFNRLTDSLNVSKCLEVDNETINSELLKEINVHKNIDGVENFAQSEANLNTSELKMSSTSTPQNCIILIKNSTNIQQEASYHHEEETSIIVPAVNDISFTNEITKISQNLDKSIDYGQGSGEDVLNWHIKESKANKSDKDIDWSKPFEPSHLKNHDKRPYKPRNKPNSCNYCGRTFRRRYQLDTHLNIHTGSKPHQCEICGRLFRAVTTLTRHLSTHEQRETHNCKFCDKAFTHKAAQLSHELRHIQERKVPCDECSKRFYTLNQMDTHKRKVHQKSDNNDLPFACDLCPKRYRSASMLSTHKFKKHYKSAKYSCQQCEKKFINEQQLEAHLIIHATRLQCSENE